MLVADFSNSVVVVAHFLSNEIEIKTKDKDQELNVEQ